MKGKKTLKLQWQCQISDKGFTLLELLLSVFIGTIVLTITYVSFFQIIKAKDITEEELELYHEARVIFSQITKDLESAYPYGMVYSDSLTSTYPYFRGTKEGEQSRVLFTSLSRNYRNDSMDSDQAEIGYYTEQNQGSETFSLIRWENPAIGVESGGIRYPISERILRFNLLFMSEGGELIEEWDSQQTRALPKAVWIQITMKSPRGEEISFDSLVTIPLAQSGG